MARRDTARRTAAAEDRMSTATADGPALADVAGPEVVADAERLRDMLAGLPRGEFTGEVFDLARSLAEDLDTGRPDTQGVDDG